MPSKDNKNGLVPSIKSSPALYGAIVALAIVAAITGTSRSALKFQLVKALECDAYVWLDVILCVSELRYGDEPEFQRAIGLARLVRSKREWEAAFDLLDRVINSNTDAETKISPLIARAEMFEKSGKLSNAIDDLKRANEFVLAREARGIKLLVKTVMKLRVVSNILRRK